MVYKRSSKLCFLSHSLYGAFLFLCGFNEATAAILVNGLCFLTLSKEPAVGLLPRRNAVALVPLLTSMMYC